MATKRTTKKKTKKKPVSPIDKARAALLKSKVPDHVVPLDEGLLTASKPHIPSGSIALDYLIGGRINAHGIAPCPGWPRGRIVQLYGDAGAGKTTVALTACTSVCNMGGTAVYIDWEHEVDAQYSADIGVPISDPERFLLVQPDTLEEGLQYLIAMAASGVDLIVLDSVSAGMPQDLYGKKLDELAETGRLGAVASVWSRLLPKVKTVVSKSGTCLIGISQRRMDIKTGFMAGKGKSHKPGGGEAWKFYPAIRMFLAVIQKEKTKQYNALNHKIEDKVMNTRVKAILEKCKVAASFGGEQAFWIRNGEGIDDIRTMIEMAVAHKLIVKVGGWHEWHTPDGEKIRVNGVNKFRELIIEHQDSLFAQIAPLFNSDKSGGAALLKAKSDEEDEEDEDDIMSAIKGVTEDDIEDTLKDLEAEL